MNRILICSDGRSFASVDAAAATGLLPQAISIAAVRTRDGIYSEYDGCQWAFKDTLPLVWPQPDPRQTVNEDKDKDNQSIISSDGRNYSSLKSAAKSTGLLRDGILFAARCTLNNVYYKYGGRQWAFASQKFRIWPRQTVDKDEDKDRCKDQSHQPVFSSDGHSYSSFKTAAKSMGLLYDGILFAARCTSNNVYYKYGGCQWAFENDLLSAWPQAKDETAYKAPMPTMECFRVRVFQDHEAPSTDYAIWASTQIDARIIAFVLDGGFPNVLGPNETFEIDLDHVELVREHTEILTGLTVPIFTPKQAAEAGRRALIDAKTDEMHACWGCLTSTQQLKGETMFKLARLLAHNNLRLETEYSDINGDVVLVLRKTDAENLCCSFDITKNDGTFEEIKERFFDPAIAYFQQVQRINTNAE